MKCSVLCVSLLSLSSLVLGHISHDGGKGGKGSNFGNLHPIHDDNVTCSRNKLYIEFDSECAPEYKDVKKAYKNLVKDFKDCLYDDKRKHKKNIYYINGTQSYHAFIYIEIEGCEDNITLNYDDYCIDDFDYEPVFTPAVSCSDESSYLWSTNYLWHTDLIDGDNDNNYEYVSNGNNYIDLYILDSGVLSTHSEFSHTSVVHLDSSFGDSSIAGFHGTHVAGIAGGNTVGTFKNAGTIYEYPSCRGGTSCSWQDILDSLQSSSDKLSQTSRRGVINMSFGGLGYSSTKSTYEGYFSTIIANGGIPVSSAGNSADESCRDDGYYYVPNSADNCISIGSYDSSLTVSSFSNYGRCVDVYGPGSSVLSATHSSDSSYSYASGTSMSGPAVSGLIANLLYVNPYLTYDEIYDIVTSDSYSVSLSGCPNDSDEGNCNGIQMSCDDIISAAGGDSSDSDDDVPDGYYRCNDGCNIYETYVDDDYCDCSDCGDESYWDCSRCSCPSSCGYWNYCPSSSYSYAVEFNKMDKNSNNEKSFAESSSSSSSDEYFTCDDGCDKIPISFVNDGSWCDCQDCSDEDEWTCDSCIGGCTTECGAKNYTYCWDETSPDSVRNIDSHNNDNSNSGSGTHCGCSGNNEEYDTLLLANLNIAIHGASEVYDFNGEWTLVNGCMNGASFYTKSIYNSIFNDYETFIIYYNGGSWVITKESNINGYFAGCPQTEIFDCNGMFWIYGTDGYDGDSHVSTQLNNVCGTSIADASTSSLSVTLGDSSDDSSSSSSGSSNNNNNNELEGWIWLLIGCAIIIAIIGIGIVYACVCTDYKIIKQGVEYDPNSYNLMQA